MPPPLLFLDLESGDDVEVAPGAVLHPWLVWEWVTGNEGPVVTGNFAARVNEFGRAQSAVRLYRRETAAAAEVHRASSVLTEAEFAGDEASMQKARAQYAATLRSLAEVLDDMVERGVTPPGKPRTWIETIRELGFSSHPDSLVIFESRSEAEQASDAS